MTRSRITTALAMTLTLAALPCGGWASEAETQAPEGPRIICMGDATEPGLLRFAFQAEPATRFRPELLRTAESARRRAPPGAAQPQARTGGQTRAPSLPTLHLPCISG